jgi:hypothetical protein
MNRATRYLEVIKRATQWNDFGLLVILLLRGQPADDRIRRNDIKNVQTLNDTSRDSMVRSIRSLDAGHIGVR